MRKTLLTLTLLLGLSAYAQDNDDASGAQMILNEMKNAATNGKSLEDAITENPQVFSKDNVIELIAAAERKQNLWKSKDILSKANLLAQTLKDLERLSEAEHKDVLNLLNKIEINVNSRPIKSLLNELKKYNIESVLTADGHIPLQALDASLSYFTGKYYLNTEEAEVIFGTLNNAFEDGLLFQADKDIKDGIVSKPSEIEQKLTLLKLKLLVSNEPISFCGEKGTVGDVSIAVSESVDTDHTIMQSLTSIDRSVFTLENVAIIKINPTYQDITKGLERFDAIKAIINK